MKRLLPVALGILTAIGGSSTAALAAGTAARTEQLLGYGDGR